MTTELHTPENNAASEKKIEAIKTLLETFDPAFKSQVAARPDGTGFTLYGPFPSLFIAVGHKLTEDGFLVSSNADAPTLAGLVIQLTQHYPELVYHGAYCESLDDTGIRYGEEARQLKEQHDVLKGLAIMKQRGLLDAETAHGHGSAILTPNKQIVIAK